MQLRDKLEILADAAKYDASCASSGAGPRDSRGGKGVGSTQRMGICHSYAPDGRCISLLKVLLTNVCIYDCLFCVNRRSSNVRRARFSVEEVVRLTIDFYKRNYIEGLFLSSGIIKTPDHTMEQMTRVARTLREEHDFRGYIHLKAIPGSSPELLRQAGTFADRISVNIELPERAALERLAPEKDLGALQGSMGVLRQEMDEAKASRGRLKFSPAGQSTQLIVGADPSDDATILGTSARLYASYRLRRVYYSGFSPIPDASSLLPLKPAPLVREHRLYRADWLMRFYGFEADEIVASMPARMLDLDVDPKLAWALANRQMFPLDVNKASRAALLRVPGLGKRAIDTILSVRRHHALRLDDLRRLRVPLKKAMPFIITAGYRPPTSLTDGLELRTRLAPPPRQMDLFAASRPEQGRNGTYA